MCGVQLKDRKRSMDLILMLFFKETIDQLAIANSVRWYGHVLRREGGHNWRRSLNVVVESQGKKGRPKRMWRKQVGEESVKISLRSKMHFAVQSGVLASVRLPLG